MVSWLCRLPSSSAVLKNGLAPTRMSLCALNVASSGPSYTVRLTSHSDPSWRSDAAHGQNAAGQDNDALLVATKKYISIFPADTLRNNDVVITSKRRHFDVITSKWHRFDVMTTLLLSNVFRGLFQTKIYYYLVSDKIHRYLISDKIHY